MGPNANAGAFTGGNLGAEGINAYAEVGETLVRASTRAATMAAMQAKHGAPQGHNVPLPSRILGRKVRPEGQGRIGMNEYLEQQMARKQTTIESLGMSSTEYGESNGADEESMEADDPKPCPPQPPVPLPRLMGPPGLEGLDQAALPGDSTQALTTLMVRNVPVMYTISMLLVEWPTNGNYDFIYLPYSVALQRNQSYAFINFTSAAAAAEFRQQWQKKRLP